MTKIKALQERLDRIEKLIILSAKSVYTTEEVSIVLGITQDRVRHLVANREIPHYKRGQRNFFKKTEIEEWQTQNRVRTVDELKQDATSYLLKQTKRIRK